MDNKRELRHYGVLGMKWGVRRYQNEDGSLTSLGRRRLGDSPNPDRVHNQVAKDYRNVNLGLNAASNAARSASNIVGRSKNHAKEKAAAKIDLSKMSDADLQKAINRLNMEKQYKNLSTESVGKGREYAADILATAGDVIVIGASVASIAVAIHTIRGGGT